MDEDNKKLKLEDNLYITNHNFMEGRFYILQVLENNRILVKSKYGVHNVSRSDLTSGLGVGIKSALDKTNYIINIFKEVHGDKYDYSLINYTSIRDKVKIICSIHGVFEQSPDSHKRGFGCSKCGYSKNMPTEEYALSQLKENNFDNSREFNILTFDGNKSKVEVTCQIGHKYTTNIYRRLKEKYSCSECHKKYLYISNNVTDDNVETIPCTLYILKFKSEQETFYKVGISKNLKKRLTNLKTKTPYNIEVISTFETSLEEAFTQEQNYLKTYKYFKYRPLINFGGSTECLSENPINLDNWQYEHYYKTVENE